MNTLSPQYMNPIPCGVKVNDVGAPSVPRSRQNPPTYKRPAQMLLNARSSVMTGVGMIRAVIRAYRHNTKTPIIRAGSAPCRPKSRFPHSSPHMARHRPTRRADANPQGNRQSRIHHRTVRPGPPARQAHTLPELRQTKGSDFGAGEMDRPGQSYR